MAAVWSIINDALAMLKEPGPEMRMINVGLMGLLVDWGTTGPAIIQLGFPEAQCTYWPGGDVHKGNMTAVVKKRDSVLATERKRQTCRQSNEGQSVNEQGRKRVGGGSGFLPVLSWEIHPFTVNQSCQRMLIKKQWNVSLLQLGRNPISFSWQMQFWIIVKSVK